VIRLTDYPVTRIKLISIPNKEILSLAGQLNKQILAAQFVDFAVIGLTFILACSLLSIDFGSSSILYITIYSAVVLISVRLGKYLLFSNFSSSNRIVMTILGNAAGFIVGAFAMLILQSFLLEFKVAAAVIFIASFMAFFVLGTVAPLLRLDRPFVIDRKIFS